VLAKASDAVNKSAVTAKRGRGKFMNFTEDTKKRGANLCYVRGLR
jgi:hypothetical protein